MTSLPPELQSVDDAWVLALQEAWAASTPLTDAQLHAVADAAVKGRRRALNSKRGKDQYLPETVGRSLIEGLEGLRHRAAVISAALRHSSGSVNAEPYRRLSKTNALRWRNAQKALKAVQDASHLNSLTDSLALAGALRDAARAMTRAVEYHASEAHRLQGQRPRPSRPPDWDSRALAIALAAWWLRQGWDPTTSPRGAFVQTLNQWTCFVLAVHCSVPGARMLKESLARARAAHRRVNESRRSSPDDSSIRQFASLLGRPGTTALEAHLDFFISAELGELSG